MGDLASLNQQRTGNESYYRRDVNELFFNSINHGNPYPCIASDTVFVIMAFAIRLRQTNKNNSSAKLETLMSVMVLVKSDASEPSSTRR